MMYWQVLETQLWGLAMLVREQGQEDHRQPIPLNRCERLRRSLDVRIYEVLLLHVRTRMIWDGVDDDGDNNDGGGDGGGRGGGGGDGCGVLNENSLEFNSSGGIRHHDSTAVLTPSGWDWLAAAAAAH